ncbi:MULTISPECIES: hypothetical protein [unclassified Phaeobacter]
MTLTDGERPCHWVDEVLDDHAVENAVEAWGETYDDVPDGS